jgi:DNA-3-methyladenine glycosylase
MSDLSHRDPDPLSYGGKIPSSFFNRHPGTVAQELLGCMLVTDSADGACGGLIVETEAYLGSEDPGSHAATRGMTARNSVMYGPPATVYVYFTYGCHHMLNLVCEPPGTAGAVLIRALEPKIGLELMRARRGNRSDVELCNGPGKLAAALGVDLADNGTRLGSGRVSVYDGQRGDSSDVTVTGRIGLRRGHELELRYHLTGNRFVSRGRCGPLGGA